MDTIFSYFRYLLFCYGLTAIFIYGDIAKPLRNLITWEPLKKMTSCAMCLGFWVGFGLYPFFYDTAHMSFPIHLFNMWYNGIISSGVTWLLCAITQGALWVKVYSEMQYNERMTPKTDMKKETELYG